MDVMKELQVIFWAILISSMDLQSGTRRNLRYNNVWSDRRRQISYQSRNLYTTFKELLWNHARLDQRNLSLIWTTTKWCNCHNKKCSQLSYTTANPEPFRFNGKKYHCDSSNKNNNIWNITTTKNHNLNHNNNNISIRLQKNVFQHLSCFEITIYRLEENYYNRENESIRYQNTIIKLNDNDGGKSINMDRYETMHGLIGQSIQRRKSTNRMKEKNIKNPFQGIIHNYKVPSLFSDEFQSGSNEYFMRKFLKQSFPFTFWNEEK